MTDRLPDDEHPGFMEKGVDFVISFSDWYAAGMPWRNPEDTHELFSAHCEGGDGPPCPFYEPDSRAFLGWPKGKCGHCGCHVSNDPHSILNLVNKPHKGCSAGKWGPIIETSLDEG